jgi:hypothetical protein
MSVNSNLTAYQLNNKKLPFPNFFLFIAGVVDTSDKPLLLKILNGPNGIFRDPQAGLEKTRVFLKNPAQWVFWVFWGFLSFFVFFVFFCFV